MKKSRAGNGRYLSPDPIKYFNENYRVKIGPGGKRICPGPTE